MRVLCTCLPEYGHFHPMVPLARCLATAGHEVAFATAREFCVWVERTGFVAFPTGIDLPEQLEEARLRFPDEASLAPSQQRFVSFVPKMLAGVAAARRVPDLIPVVTGWKPDLVLHDETDFAGPIAAEATGIPYAAHSLGILRPLEMARLAGETIAPLAKEWGVDLGPLGGLFRYLYLDICPPSLQAAHIREIAVAHHLRPVPFDGAGPKRLPPWVGELPAAPTVYVTLGTVFNQNPRVFTTILDGLRDEAVNVIVTVGTDEDPEALGPQPDNVHVERYIPQSALLPHCDVVVTHGGTGSMLAALAHGLPLLVVPQGANQFGNAAACVSSGVGRRLTPAELSANTVRRELRALLEDGAHRVSAQRIQEEMQLMPGPKVAVPLLEQLERKRQPLTRHRR